MNSMPSLFLGLNFTVSILAIAVADLPFFVDNDLSTTSFHLSQGQSDSMWATSAVHDD